MQKQKCIWMFLGSRSSKEGKGWAGGVGAQVGRCLPPRPCCPLRRPQAAGPWGSWARGLRLPIRAGVCTRLRTQTGPGNVLLRETSRNVWWTASFPKATFTFSFDRKPTRDSTSGRRLSYCLRNGSSSHTCNFYFLF